MFNDRQASQKNSRDLNPLKCNKKRRDYLNMFPKMLRDFDGNRWVSEMLERKHVGSSSWSKRQG